MSKKSAPIPVYSLGNSQNCNVHLRPMQDYIMPRPSVESSHSDSYYIFICQHTGESHLMVDFEEVVLRGCCIYYIAPGQVHHFISSKNTSGWILASEPLSIDKNYLRVLERDFSYQSPVTINLQNYNRIENCLKSLLDLLSEKTAGYLRDSLLYNMVSVCTGLFSSFLTGPVDSSPHNRPMYLFQEFRILLRARYRYEKSPSVYAGLLNISHSYLNECVKAVSGKPVSYWIQEQVITAAKRLLAYSNLGIKQIAYDLGYIDDTYFMRLFKKSRGTTPSAFRKLYRE